MSLRSVRNEPVAPYGTREPSGTPRDGRGQQAWFREASPTITHVPEADLDEKARQHGHLLAPRHALENLYPSLRPEGKAQAFFKERGIKWWLSVASGDPKGGEGPTRNLASSQVACVNFLMPLAQEESVLTEMLRFLDADVRDVCELRYKPRGREQEAVSLAEFEWIGLRTPLESKRYTRGAHVTSADALVVGETESGNRRAYLFEWKYTERYAIGDYKGDGDRGEERKARYTEPYASSPSFSKVVPLQDLFYEPFYQIMRLGLLADKMIREGEFGVTDARIVVVCPQENEAYRNRVTSPRLRARFPDLGTVEAAARRLWRDPSWFRMTAPEVLAGAVHPRCASGPLQNWFEYMTERYGWSLRTS